MGHATTTSLINFQIFPFKKKGKTAEPFSKWFHTLFIVATVIKSRARVRHLIKHRGTVTSAVLIYILYNISHLTSRKKIISKPLVCNC